MRAQFGRTRLAAALIVAAAVALGGLYFHFTDSQAAATDEITMSLAAAGNHLTRFTTEGKHIPPELLPRVKELGARYTFADHVAPGSANCRLIEELGLVDYLADRFAAAGTPDDCIGKLERAAGAGARQFWMSVHFNDKVRFLRDWAEKVMPAFR